jgi:hypothetical protein
MPRIVEFTPLVDTIPEGSKYLYSHTRTFTVVEALTEEQRHALDIQQQMERLNIGKPDQKLVDPPKADVYHITNCFYEVSDDAFRKLIQDGFFLLTPQEKVNLFRSQIANKHL